MQTLRPKPLKLLFAVYLNEKFSSGRYIFIVRMFSVIFFYYKQNEDTLYFI